MGWDRSRRRLRALFTISLAFGLAFASWGCGEKGRESKAENKTVATSTQKSQTIGQAGATQDSGSTGTQPMEASAGQSEKLETNGIQTKTEQTASQITPTSKPQSSTSKTADKQRPTKLPKMVDLGRNTCIPCRMMAPILEELKKEYEGRAIIEVIDLRENMEAARKYRIRVIPTQIFFDAEGNEVWRHEGYMPKEQIVAKLAELGAKPVK